MLVSDVHTQKSSAETALANEAEVWQAFTSGSKAAFSWLYHAFFNDLYNYCHRITGDEETAKDNVQDFFTDLWEKKESLPPVAAVKPYLLKSLRNRTINMMKQGNRNRLRIEHFMGAQTSITFSQEDFVMEDESQKRQQQLIASLLNQLPGRRKEAVYLRYFKNLSYPEIAQVMSLTEKAVINHIYKAIKSLKKNDKLKNILQIISVLFCTSPLILML